MRKRLYWILDENGTPQATDDILEWGAFFESPARMKFALNTELDDVMVSTVFLGLDHGLGYLFGRDEPPIIFETMIFGGPEDGYQERYATWKEATDGHARAVARADQAKAEIDKTIDDLVVGRSESG